jgi:hypothetical protein
MEPPAGVRRDRSCALACGSVASGSRRGTTSGRVPV